MQNTGFIEEIGVIKKIGEESKDIKRALGIITQREDKKEEFESEVESNKVFSLLKVAALYHDIGKAIRDANHPQIGANILRSLDSDESLELVNALGSRYRDERTNAKENRFSLIVSVVQHHAKFGVVSTGEAALPVFSDLLYYTSDESNIPGIKKNITAVMLVNLADIAAYNPIRGALDNRHGVSNKSAMEIAAKLRKIRGAKPRSGANKSKQRSVTRERDTEGEIVVEQELLLALQKECENPKFCLGLTEEQVSNIFEDWHILLEAVEDERVLGNRNRLKLRLLEIERNPCRVIKRITRLLRQSFLTSNTPMFVDEKFLSPTKVEGVLVGTLGSHQFQNFCDLFATVVQLEYALAFFKAIVCANVRKKLVLQYSLKDNRCNKWPPDRLNDEEVKRLQKALSSRSHPLSKNKAQSELVEGIISLFVRVLETLIDRYTGVLNYSTTNPRRFGFQLRNLTADANIRDTVIRCLCIEEHKEAVALTWIADEVTIWSID